MTIHGALRLERGEGERFGFSFAFFFFLMCGYSILRPIRDEMGIQGGVDALPYIFTVTFLAMSVLVPAFGRAVRRVPVRRLAPGVYLTLVANLAIFYAFFRLEYGGVWTARVFFVWVSVMNLFAVSIFWSFMGDVFTPEESRRVYGSVAGGGSAGAIAGPALTAILAQVLGPIELLPISALSLLLALVCAGRLAARFAGSVAAGERASVRRADPDGAWENPIAIVRHPYLRVAATFVILYAVLSTFLYFEQAEILKKAMPDSGQRTAVFALMDLAVNTLTLGAQLFATSRVVGRFGLPATLAAVPLAVATGFVLLAVFPIAATLFAFQVIRRAGNYALTRPGREMLFAVLPAAGRYQAKSFIDTVVYRGGDALGGWIAAGVMGLGLPLAPLGVPLALTWALCGIWLGRRQADIYRVEVLAE